MNKKDIITNPKLLEYLKKSYNPTIFIENVEQNIIDLGLAKEIVNKLINGDELNEDDNEKLAVLTPSKAKLKKDIITNPVLLEYLKVKKAYNPTWFIEKVDANIIGLRYAEALVNKLINGEKLDSSENSMLTIWDCVKPKIKINKLIFSRRTKLLLAKLQVSKKDIPLIVKNLVALYKKANEIVEKPIEIGGEYEEVAISDFCMYNDGGSDFLSLELMNDPNYDTDEENTWYRKEFFLFARDESGGPFYYKIAGDNIHSIWWLDHETLDDKLMISQNFEDFMRLFDIIA